MGYNYAYQGDLSNAARAVALNIPCSTKQAIMLAKFVRGKPVARAIRDLKAVLDMKMAVPFTRFTEGAGHKPGIGPGKYPQKATKALLEIINSAVANAEDKGLGSELVIVGCTVNKGPKMMRYGRHRGRQRKSTHLEVVVAEQEVKNGN